MKRLIPRSSGGGLILGVLGVLATFSGCYRKESSPPPPSIIAPDHPQAPWSWHKLGGLLVVVGEVDEPMDLVLKGRYLNETMHAEFGPLRWEMYAPPPGEIAELRTKEGKLLARWEFDAPVKPVLPAKPTVRIKPVTPVKPVVSAKSVVPERPVAPLPLPKTPLKIKLENIPWPETHLPLVHGPAVKPVRALNPSPVLAKAIPAVPEASAPTVPPPAAPLVEMPLKPLPSDISKEWPGAGEGLNLIRGPRGSHWVCMTFDGGSTSEVALDVLDALKERGIHTTFFLTGAFIQKYPDIVRRIDREGHEIGNHTMDHPHFAPRGRRDPRWTKERFQQQLLLADSLLLQLLGRPMDPYWRAPYGEQTTELRKWAEELGYRHVFWSEGADTLDWATTKERKLYRTGNAILDRLYSRMEKDDGDGLIVLMHLGSGRPMTDRPARVLGPFLDKALEEGWNFVNISAYLKESGKPQWNSSNRLAMLGQTPPRQ